MMINWGEFEHIHVIKKLKEILLSWWQIDLIFTDDRGIIKSPNSDTTSLFNPAVAYAFKNEEVQKNLTQFVVKALEQLKHTQERYAVVQWDMTGYDILVVPIIIDNDLVGTVVALGFLKDQSDTNQRFEEIKKRLSHLNLSENQVTESLDHIKTLNEAQRGHFTDLTELVAKEVITLHLEITAREERINSLNKELGSRYKYDNMIGQSQPMQNLYAMLDRINSTESTVLIQGENGTGKELIAKAVHYNSRRKNKAFVIQNCSSFNDNLLESELFGHVKGSFTGAIKDKKGLFEAADKGTFFLDEIGDTSPSMQVKLLRVLQEGTFMSVGGIEPKSVDVRIIAATNKLLGEMVEKGLFREDLYYRLNVINLHVPALRDRREDIPVLIEHFLEKSSKQMGVKKMITKSAIKKLYDYAWPGNIRELQNEIERTVVLSGNEEQITAQMLSDRITNASSESRKINNSRLSKLKDALEELEREMIKEGLRRTGWNKSRLAKELGISRAGLIMKVEKYNLDKRRLVR